MNYLGMTGKFHWLWGEVGGYKKADALVYECGAMLAQGARCSIGDHLHPTARIDASSMATIGAAYEWVEAREPWCRDTVNRAEIGLLSLEAVTQKGLTGWPARNNAPDEGAVRVLMEGRFTFDVLDLESNFSAYRLVILPDEIRVSADLRDKLTAYLGQGGRVMLTGKSGLLPEGGFALDVGADWVATSPMTGGDYLMPAPPLRAEGVNDPMFMYLPSEQLALTDGTPLGEIYDPYFDRTMRHFSGHVNAPSQPGPNGRPAAVEKGNILYLAHPIFSCYYKSGAVAMLEMALQCIRRALDCAPMIDVDLPQAGRATLRACPPRHRDILHLLHATPALRGTLGSQPVQPIQDLITLTDIAASIETTGKVVSVRQVPEGRELAFVQDGDRVRFLVPILRGHAMVEISYR